MSVVRGARLHIAICAAILLAYAIVIGFLPLFDVLGFELAFATSIVVAITGLHVGAALARARQRIPVTFASAGFAGRSVLAAAARASAVAVAIALVPGLVAAVRGLWHTTCDWWFGISCYAALPLATAALAGALGWAIGTAIGANRPVRSGFVAVLVPLVALVAAGLHRLYAAPPVFSFNALVGYFPGSLYDENVQLTAAVGWARLEALLGLVAILAFVATRFDVPSARFRIREVRPHGPRVGAYALATVALAGAVVLHAFGGELGFAVDADDIADELGGTIETPHFTIHYAKELAAEMPLIAADHEFRYGQVVAQLGAAPDGKLTSFYFANRDQKARWIGARDVEMAKPWREEVYLDHRAFPHPSLRHEIAHAVASAFGDPIFGVSTRRLVLANPGIIEGLAVATDWPGGYDHPTPHQQVRAMQAMGMSPSIDDLLSLRFLTVSSARGYATAGSFLRFLLDRYGAPALRAMYGSGGDFDAAYGKPRATLEAEWLAMIATIQLPKDAVEGSRERFRAGSVFARPCPHANAARREEAAQLFAANHRANAVALLRDVCSDAPDEPRYRLELGDYLVGGAPGERTEAESIWHALIADAERVTSSIRAEASERLAHLAAAHGDLATVHALIDAAAALPVDDNQHRQLLAEQFALAYQGPAGAALRGYFFGTVPWFPPKLSAQIGTYAEPTLGLPHYLLGLQDATSADYPACAAELDRGLALGLPDLVFVENGARRLAICAFRAGDYARTTIAIAWLSGNAMTEADHLLARDWQQRLVFTFR